MIWSHPPPRSSSHSSTWSESRYSSRNQGSCSVSGKTSAATRAHEYASRSLTPKSMTSYECTATKQASDGNTFGRVIGSSSTTIFSCVGVGAAAGVDRVSPQAEARTKNRKPETKTRTVEPISAEQTGAHPPVGLAFRPLLAVP